MVNELSIGQRRGSVECLAAGLRGVGGQRGNQVRLFCRIPWRELLAEGHLDIHRFGIALGGDHVGTEELALARTRDLRSKIFDKHAAFEVVGMQGSPARHAVIPQRAAFRRCGVARIVARIVAHWHELIHHVAGHETVVNHVGRHDPPRRDVHQRAIERLFRPIHRPLRHIGRRRDGKHLGLELVGRRRLATGAGVRQVRDPSHRHPSRLGRKHLTGVRAVIIRQRRRKFPGRRAADRFARFAPQRQGEPVDDVHPLAEQGRTTHQSTGHQSDRHHIARWRTARHIHTAGRHQGLARAIEVNEVVIGKKFARLDRLGTPIGARRDGSAPVHLRPLDHIAEGVARHARGQAVADAGAGQNCRHLRRGGIGVIARARVTTGADPRNRNRTRTRRSGPDAGELRRGGTRARGDGRRGDAHRRRRAGAVAAAAIDNRDRGHHSIRQHRRGRGRAAAARPDGDHGRRRVTRTTAPNGESRDHSVLRNRGKTACPPLIEQVARSALDLQLGLDHRGQ